MMGLLHTYQAQILPAQEENSGEPSLTEDQMKQFLLNAEVIKSKRSKKGITSPYVLTLTDGTLTHDGVFQPVDEMKSMKTFDSGRVELNFRDTYHFNLAAYELAKMLGIGDMMPVHVIRKWDGKEGSLSWWIPVMMDESERLSKKIPVPDPLAWNQQMYKIRVFSELVYDTDRNLTNVLIGKDWKLYMIDFTRAFRLYNTLKEPKNLVMCERELLDKLRTLDAADLSLRTEDQLTKSEVQAVMARRDKIVQHFERLIAEKGKAAVLY